MMPWAKKFYIRIAAVAFSAFLLLGGANIAFYTALQFKEYIKAYITLANPVGEKYGNMLRDAYPEMTMAEINDLLVETWTRPQAYDPVVQFREGSLNGVYVKVDPAGFRHSIAQGTWPPSKSNYNIFLFGSSSTFGYGLPDHQTIPSYIQKTLKTIDKRPVKVYNFGRGLFFSTQERRLFERLLFEGFVPDAAIFINGLSEFSSPGVGLPFTRRLSDALDSGFMARLGWTVEAMPLTRLFKWLRKRINRRNTAEPNSGSPAEQTGAKMDENQVELLIKRYLLNVQLSNTLARLFGVVATFVWQPVSTYRVPSSAVPLSKVDMGNHILAGKAYSIARPMLDKHFSSTRFIWCADIQNDIFEPLYVDAVHYNARASAIFASCITDVISQREILKTGSR